MRKTYLLLYFIESTHIERPHSQFSFEVFQEYDLFISRTFASNLTGTHNAQIIDGGTGKQDIFVQKIHAGMDSMYTYSISPLP